MIKDEATSRRLSHAISDVHPMNISTDGPIQLWKRACNNLGYLPTLSKLRRENVRIAVPRRHRYRNPLVQSSCGAASVRDGSLLARVTKRRRRPWSEFLREKERPAGASSRRALHQALKTDNGRTGAPHSSKRHFAAVLLRRRWRQSDSSRVVPRETDQREERTSACRNVLRSTGRISVRMRHGRFTWRSDETSEIWSEVNDIIRLTRFFFLFQEFVRTNFKIDDDEEYVMMFAWRKTNTHARTSLTIAIVMNSSIVNREMRTKGN